MQNKVGSNDITVKETHRMCKVVKRTVAVLAGLVAAVFAGIFLIGVFSDLTRGELDEAV